MRKITGLDSYRAIAAIIVMFSHCVMFMERALPGTSFFCPKGQTGVVLFFTLSGFLICSLLCHEMKEKSTIKLSWFFLRRILRIWPLYYLILILSWIVLKMEPSSTSIALCFSIFPNIAHAIKDGWSGSPQVWSIGVEEQFYLTLPFIILIFKKHKYIFAILTGFVFLYSLFPHLAGYYNNNYLNNSVDLELLDRFFYATKYNCIALGALFGMIYFKYGEKIKSALKKLKYIRILFIILPFVTWTLDLRLSYFNDEVYSVLFAISILIASCIQIEVSKYNVVEKLGKYSYGIYMFHWIVLELIFRTALQDQLSQTSVILVYTIGTTIATIALSILSFHFFEMPFLNLKKRYRSIS